MKRRLLKPHARLATAMLATAAGRTHAAATAAPPSDDATLRTAITSGSVSSLLQIAEARTRGGDLAGAAEPLRHALALAPNSERVLAAYARTAMAARAPGQAVLALEPLERMHATVP